MPPVEPAPLVAVAVQPITNQTRPGGFGGDRGQCRQSRRAAKEALACHAMLEDDHTARTSSSGVGRGAALVGVPGCLAFTSQRRVHPSRSGNVRSGTVGVAAARRRGCIWIVRRDTRSGHVIQRYAVCRTSCCSCSGLSPPFNQSLECLLAEPAWRRGRSVIARRRRNPMMLLSDVGQVRNA